MSDQIPLIGPRGGLRPRTTRRPAEALVAHAQVLVDAKSAHVSRVFDYGVPQRLHDRIVPGCRVKVPVGASALPGIVVSLEPSGEFSGDLRAISSVVSPVPVLQPQILDLCRRVADHYAGSLADVVRFAVPPRVASLERGWGGQNGGGAAPPVPARRSAWVCPPGTDWVAALSARARAVAATGRGALIVVPDGRDIDRLAAHATDPDGPAVAVLRADDGSHARYEQFLAVLSGEARIVIGTRSAAFAPVRDLGLAVIWDDTSDTYAEQRAPYWHAREVLAFRSHLERCDLVIAGHARSCEAQRWVGARWLRADEDREQIRRNRPAVRPVGDPRSPFDSVRRFPDAAVGALRAGLESGPVLVHVSRSGHVPVTACQGCRELANCPACGGALAIDADERVRCRRCGRGVGFTCPNCGSDELRAVRVGATRIAEELGRLFPRQVVRISTAASHIDQVDSAPAIVVATPGAEPRCPSGFTAAYLPDAQLDVWRTELRARENALARWLNGCSQVRPHSPVVVNADGDDETVQAFVRWDPAGFAERELETRSQMQLPPARQLLQVDGSSPGVDGLLAALPDEVALLGPRDLDASGDRVRVLLRSADFPAMRDLVKEFADAHQLRGTHAWRVQVDPPEVE